MSTNNSNETAGSLPPAVEDLFVPPNNTTAASPTNETAGGPALITDPTDAQVADDLTEVSIDALGNLSDPYFLPQRIVDYNKAQSTKDFGGIPRFGHSNDISRIAYFSTDDNAAGEDYVMGLLFAGCFLLVFFLIWSLVIIIFKFSLTGFLNGSSFVNPHLDNPEEQKRKREMLEDGEEYIEDPSWLKRPRRIRTTFFICGFLNILFAILLVTKGVSNLQETTDTIQVSNANLQILVDEAIQNIQTLDKVGQTGFALKDQIVFDLDEDNFCPDNPLLGETDMGKQILGGTKAAVSLLNSLGDFVGDDVKALEESLQDSKRYLVDVDDSINDVESNEWLGGLIAFPFLILSSLMMVGVLAAQINTMTDCFLCVLNWVVLPIFIFATILSYVTLSLSSIAVSANADLCGGESKTPDQVIVDTMYRAGFATDDLVFQTVRYYAYQCTREAQTDPFQFLRSFDLVVETGRDAILNLTDTMNEISLDQLSLGCNRDFQPLHRSLSQMVGVLEAFLQTASRGLNLLRCERIVPVYTTIVYDAGCKYSMFGFTWIFSSLLIVSVTGMIMIMFRSAYQNTIYERLPQELLDESSGGRTRTRTKQSMPEPLKKQQSKASIAASEGERFRDED